MERAVEYRRAEKDQQQHRSKIDHTWTSLTTKDPKDIGSPRNIADALRMHWGLWERLRPLVIEELEKQRLPPSVLTLNWAQRVLSFFERSFLADNCEALRCGVLENVTGMKYYSINPRFCHITLKLRMIREGFSDCEGAFPTVPCVRVERGTSTLGDERPWKVAWEPDMPEGSDPREIYKTDGDKTLNFYEFILWTVHLGFALPMDLNEKYFTEDKDGHNAEPIAYVPAPWVGRPKMWAKERDGGFPRWIWMRDPVIDWSGQGIPQEGLVRMSEENMRHCCVCYGLPPEGQELTCASAAMLSIALMSASAVSWKFTSSIPISSIRKHCSRAWHAEKKKLDCRAAGVVRMLCIATRHARKETGSSIRNSVCQAKTKVKKKL